MSDLLLPLDAFIRSIGVSRTVPHALFLGAGASISSGMPSAQMCIWEWKRAIFLTNNVGLENQFTELSLASKRQQIQRWLDRQGLYPPDGDHGEYGVYVEACYPIPESRRAFFQEKVRKAQPHIGYQLLGLLAANRLIRSVWTTNFDQLPARAAAPFEVVPVEVGIDSQHRTIRAAREGELLVVSLHGDYRYDALKNTAAELQRQEQVLAAALVDEYRDTPVIVCGYSGRDESVMAAFAAAYAQKGAGILYWCVQDAANVPTSVLDLIGQARSHGHGAYVVPIQGFDDLMVRIAMHCLDDAGRLRVTQIIEATTGSQELPRKAFQIDRTAPTGVLKSNAFELECPSEVLALELTDWPPEHVWQWVRDQTAGKAVIAVPFRGAILALGTVDEARACFGANIKGAVQRTPITDKDLRREEGVIVRLMREALIQALSVEHGLLTDGSQELWFPRASAHETVDGTRYEVHDSVQVYLRHIEGRQFLVLKPSVKILTVTGEPAASTIANPLKLRILGWQHNKEFNDAVNRWRTMLLSADGPQKSYEYPPRCGSTFRFLIRRSPAFVEICGGKGRPAINVEARYRPLLKHRGTEIEEPRLLFANKTGTGIVRDMHPVRGVMNNRPFDYPLTLQGLGTDLRLGVVCPKAETRILQGYLQQLDRAIPPSTHEADYLPTFPGLQAAFGVSPVIPEPGGPGWVTCPEPEGVDDHAKAVEVGKSINRAIEMLRAASAPHVVLIFFPERWSRYRGYTTEAERFDVHDFVKASSVQQGIGTQFLEQSTLADNLQCRVRWWLSLAFYVKAMRTPWVLDSLDRDTAFVGLGMSQRPGAERGKHIVMGCSHIYSSRGEGLQYRLSPVENPVFFGRNPFLSRDDARRVGEQIRELFFDSRDKLPSRVVIHKRTWFSKDERLGLREGLSGVQHVEMLEIVIDEAFRYVASTVDAHGGLHEDSYPVRRGSVVRLDDVTALVWVHGVTTAVSGNRRYYQGKRRIPAPLVVRRHTGQSDIRTVAEEILGLSKMNWNTFDLYTKLPATVQSSNEIARIGSLLEYFNKTSYDFRLFI